MASTVFIHLEPSSVAFRMNSVWFNCMLRVLPRLAASPQRRECRVAGFTTFCACCTLPIPCLRRCMPFRRRHDVFARVAHCQELDSPLPFVRGSCRVQRPAQNAAQHSIPGLGRAWLCGGSRLAESTKATGLSDFGHWIRHYLVNYVRRRSRYDKRDPVSNAQAQRQGRTARSRAVQCLGETERVSVRLLGSTDPENSDRNSSTSGTQTASIGPQSPLKMRGATSPTFLDGSVNRPGPSGRKPYTPKALR
jgi:hypothetical protein